MGRREWVYVQVYVHEHTCGGHKSNLGVASQQLSGTLILKIIVVVIVSVITIIVVVGAGHMP